MRMEFTLLEKAGGGLSPISRPHLVVVGCANARVAGELTGFSVNCIRHLLVRTITTFHCYWCDSHEFAYCLLA